MSHESKPALRRSRRWIELRTTAGPDARDPGDRDERNRAEPTADTDVPATPGEARTVTAPPEAPFVSPVSAFSDLSVLVARLAATTIVESGRFVRDLTAHTARRARVERVQRRT